MWMMNTNTLKQCFDMDWPFTLLDEGVDVDKYTSTLHTNCTRTYLIQRHDWQVFVCVCVCVSVWSLYGFILVSVIQTLNDEVLLRCICVLKFSLL